MTRLRIVFAGTPPFAATHLAALLAASDHFDVVAVYTQPDRPDGRGKQPQPSAVKTLALEHDLPVYQPLSLRDPAAQQELAALAPDVMVVVAYGLILPAAVLAIPRLGCVNVHASLLPRWRGAAPIQRAIEAGDAETGVTIMQMDEGLDTGPMLATARCAIAGDDTAASLHNKLAELGGPTLIATLAALAAGTAQAEPQPEAGACYASKIDKQEARLDWAQPASVLERRIRAFNPAPIAFTELEGSRIRIHRAHVSPAGSAAAPGTLLDASPDGLTVQCGEQALTITDLQLPGGKVLSAAAVLNGHAALLRPGVVFASA